MKTTAAILLLLTACSSDGWTARAKRWCMQRKLVCEVDYGRDEVGIVQPEGGEAFMLRCEEKLCVKADIPPPKSDDTFIYMPPPAPAAR